MIDIELSKMSTLEKLDDDIFTLNYISYIKSIANTDPIFCVKYSKLLEINGSDTGENFFKRIPEKKLDEIIDKIETGISDPVICFKIKDIIK